MLYLMSSPQQHQSESCAGSAYMYQDALQQLPVPPQSFRLAEVGVSNAALCMDLILYKHINMQHYHIINLTGNLFWHCVCCLCFDCTLFAAYCYLVLLQFAPTLMFIYSFLQYLYLHSFKFVLQELESNFPHDLINLWLSID